MKKLNSWTDKLQVWCYGGGTQSCAVAALIVKGQLAIPDLSLIVDTGYETAATWRYLDEVISPALAAVGVRIHRIAQGAGPKKLFTAGKECLLPVYSTATGVTIKKENLCAKMWKVDVVNRWLAERGIKKSMRRLWIGFAYDEQRRWHHWYNHSDYLRGRLYFPLVYRGITRADALELVASMGWPPPPHSACLMCPNRSDDEWLQLKQQSPDEFAKAVEIEREIKEINEHAWLHRSCVPLEQVSFKPGGPAKRRCYLSFI